MKKVIGTIIIEGRGLASRNSVSNFRGSRFEDRYGKWSFRLRYLAVFLSPLQASVDRLIKSNDHKHPSTFLELVSH
jgi:hypothetical protein